MILLLFFICNLRFKKEKEKSDDVYGGYGAQTGKKKLC